MASAGQGSAGSGGKTSKQVPFLLRTVSNLGSEPSIHGRAGLYQKGQIVDKWDEIVCVRFAGVGACVGRVAGSPEPADLVD